MSATADSPALQPGCEGGLLAEEVLLLADPRWQQAVDLFNAADWYGCHDGFEELWHETQGPMRLVLQGILQIAVGQLHMDRGNRHGAMVLTGEGLGRLRSCDDQALGLDLRDLCQQGSLWLQALQADAETCSLPRPSLRKPGTSPR